MVRHAVFASAAVVALWAGDARGAFLSFASDTSHQNWTFRGSGSTIGQGMPSGAGPVLLIDDNNGPLPALSLPVTFNASLFSLTNVASFPAGNAWNHTYTLGGTFSFTFSDANLGQLQIAVSVRGAFLDAKGTETRWGSTATIQASDDYSTQLTYTISGFGPILGTVAPYGLAPGISDSVGANFDQFAFALDAINTNGGVPGLPPAGTRGVALDPQTKLPTQQWWSEASFVGATVVPGPGAAGLLAAAALAGLRPRRVRRG
ncbi:MAG: hypothetical protein IBJ11_05775 [Phycisphaerales bacterium]|nr:hypothetical protein [Phycisphaerales bacterium]